jgi:hypothetical protein
VRDGTQWLGYEILRKHAVHHALRVREGLTRESNIGAAAWRSAAFARTRGPHR